MKTFFISWEIRPSAGQIAYSNCVIALADSVKPKQVFEDSVKHIQNHYKVTGEKVTARAFNEISTPI